MKNDDQKLHEDPTFQAALAAMNDKADPAKVPPQFVPFDSVGVIVDSQRERRRYAILRTAGNIYAAGRVTYRDAVVHARNLLEMVEELDKQEGK